MKEKIQTYLTTKELARNIKEYEELDSTQTKAKELIGVEVNGTMILANYQTKGQGTQERKWYSQKGENITFTLILYPNCAIEELEGLTIRIAEVIKESLNALYGIKVEIKKPNDIILHGKKLAGILTQTSTIEKKVQYLLIGIGLNVDQEEFPKEIQTIATSLKKEYKKDFEIEKIIAEICNKLEESLTRD